VSKQARPVVWQDVEEFDVRLTRLLRMVLDLADRIDRLERRIAELA
jgi:hypothetical protein